MIIPAILEQDFSELNHKLALVTEFAPLVQLDVVDGLLPVAPGKTFLDLQQLKTLQPKAELELHMLVADPLAYLVPDLKLKRVYIQVECHNLKTVFDQCSMWGYEPALSIAPRSDPALLEPYLTQVSKVQFMTILPGRQGNPFLPYVVKTLAAFHTTHPQITLQVDGGIRPDTVLLAKAAGASRFVVGSYLFETPQPVAAFIELQNLVY